MANKDKKDEGAQFVRYFGPLLDALRGLGGSAKVDEAVDRVANDLNIWDDVLNELELGLRAVATFEVEHTFFNEFKV